MIFWSLVGAVVAVVLAIAWWSDRRRRGQQPRNVGREVRRLRRSVDDTGRYWGRK
ncbi:MAG TPA: hypothetical protein VF416_08950 [Marmoricola sp.]